MISKELLSEVLGGNYVHMKDNTSLNPRGIDIVYCEDRGLGGTVRARAINIYELAHKCKEWAKENEHSLSSGFREDDGVWYANCMNSSQDRTLYIVADTEPEAIFKACEWIKEQHDN